MDDRYDGLIALAVVQKRLAIEREQASPRPDPIREFVRIEADMRLDRLIVLKVKS